MGCKNCEEIRRRMKEQIKHVRKTAGEFRAKLKTQKAGK